MLPKFVQKLFVATPWIEPPKKGKAIPTGEATQPGLNVFLTPQSIATFPVASLAVTIVWRLAAKLSPNHGKSSWVPVITALIIGGVIFMGGLSDEDTKPKSTRPWIVSVVVGILNSLFLAAAALGLLAGLKPE